MKQLGLYDAKDLGALFGEEEGGLQDRYYQTDAHGAIVQDLAAHRSVLVDMPTGTGKTHVFSMLCRDFPGRTLVLAHRDELLTQAEERLERMLGEMVGREQAERGAYRQRVVVGSVQTVRNDKRLEKLRNLGGFDLIVVDEAHHGTADSYVKILGAFPDAKVVGFTATPFRGDGKALGKIFEKVSYSMGIERAVDEGWLVPLVGHREYLDKLDLAHIKTNRGDLDQHELEEEMLKHLEWICAKVVELYPDRRGPIFLPGKRTAEYACARLNLLRPGSAECLTDDTPAELRDSLKQRLKNGEIRYLCNVMVATEGFDWPEANLVVLGRFTKSLVVYTQMIGRGTRPWPGYIDAFPEQANSDIRRQLIAASPKPDCVVLDFVGNTGRHKIRTLVDIFAGDYTDAEKAKAKELEIKAPAEAQKNLKAARQELKRLAAQVKVKVEGHGEIFDIFSGLGISKKEIDKHTARFGFTPATPEQLRFLSDVGLETTGLSRKAASRAISAIILRRNKGLATVKQLKLLREFGWTQKNIRLQTATRLLDFAIGEKRRGVAVEKTDLEAFLAGTPVAPEPQLWPAEHTSPEPLRSPPQREFRG